MNVAELRQLAQEKIESAQALTEGESFGEEQRAGYDALLVEIEQLRADADRLERLEGFLGVSKPVTNAPAVQMRRVRDTEESIFCHYVRTGDWGAAAELRAYNNTDMNITTAADGEVLVPVGMVSDIVARRDEMALFPRLGVRRVPGKGTTVNYPIDNEPDVIFASVAEAGNVLQDAPAVTEKAFTLVKYGKHITMTWELLRDEDVNLIAFLNDWIARGWAGTHNSLLVTEVLANGTAGLTLDAAAAVGAGEIPELVGKLMPEYQEGAQWLMHPSTDAHIQGLQGDNFHFAPTPYGGVGQSLWGYRKNTTSYMTAFAASVKSLVFGNFNFLGMREGTGLTILRDPYTAATTGQTRLWVWFDAVYGVLQAEAIQYATHPSA